MLNTKKRFRKDFEKEVPNQYASIRNQLNLPVQSHTTSVQNKNKSNQISFRPILIVLVFLFLFIPISRFVFQSGSHNAPGSQNPNIENNYITKLTHNENMTNTIKTSLSYTMNINSIYEMKGTSYYRINTNSGLSSFYQICYIQEDQIQYTEGTILNEFKLKSELSKINSENILWISQSKENRIESYVTYENQNYVLFGVFDFKTIEIENQTSKDIFIIQNVKWKESSVELLQTNELQKEYNELDGTYLILGEYFSNLNNDCNTSMLYCNIPSIRYQILKTNMSSSGEKILIPDQTEGLTTSKNEYISLSNFLTYIR